MTKLNSNSGCSKCGGVKVKPWKELSEDEKTIARRLPDANMLTTSELKHLSFCVRCWNVSPADDPRLA
ncbi:MAG: hypothetical protein HOP17_08100 [Acidobacteria bacterium]|nr:hypothetical protein [Acidobacteriota bacterium]